LLGVVDSRNDRVYDDIYQELEVIAMKDESLRETFKSWEELSMEQEQREMYEGRLKRILDEEAAKREAELRMEEAVQEAKQKAEQKDEQKAKRERQKGRQEGKQQGKQEGSQEEKENIAERLLEEGMDIELVSHTTGLAKNKVIGIQRHLQK